MRDVEGCYKSHRKSDISDGNTHFGYSYSAGWADHNLHQRLEFENQKQLLSFEFQLEINLCKFCSKSLLSRTWIRGHCPLEVLKEGTTGVAIKGGCCIGNIGLGCTGPEAITG